jgi:hypothetical protein
MELSQGKYKGNAVGAATDYFLDDQISVPGKCKIVFSTSQRPDRLWDQQASYNVYSGLFPGEKWSGHEADYSPP